VGEHRKGLHVRKIDILSDSQAANKVLDSLQINSKLAWDCHQSLVRQAKQQDSTGMGARTHGN